jgi:hypothetical protein
MYLPAIYRESVRLIPWFDAPWSFASLDKVKSVIRDRSNQWAASGERSTRVTIHNQRPPGTPTFRVQSIPGLAPGHIVYRTD